MKTNAKKFPKKQGKKQKMENKKRYSSDELNKTDNLTKKI